MTKNPQFPQNANMTYKSFLSSKQGFTLIEIIVACSVLWLVVFAVLRMTTNNLHQGKLIEQEGIQTQVAKTIETCIRSIGYTGMTSHLNTSGSINFWTNNNECNIGVGKIIQVKEKIWGQDAAPIEIENEFFVSLWSIHDSYKINLVTSSEKNSQTREFYIYK